VLIGSWVDLVIDLARAWGISFEVHGAGEGSASSEGEDSRPWVRLCKRGMEQREPAATHLLAWVRGVLREHDPAMNVACARALAAVDWPAALLWLERRWIENDDQACLQGVLLAAGRGRIVPSLAEGRRVRALLQQSDRSLAESAVGSARRAETLARALVALGPVFNDASPVADVLMERWEELTPAARWVRLVSLEGSAGTRPKGRALAQRVLQGDSAPGLIWQSLRALLALAPEAGEADLVFSRPAATLRWARTAGRLDTLVRMLASLGIAPPPVTELAELANDPDLDLSLLDWYVHAERWEGLDERLVRVLATEAGSDALASRLREWSSVGEVELVDRLLAHARDSSRLAPAAVTRLALRAGRIEEAAARAEVARIVALADLSPADGGDLGELCAHPVVGWRARDAFLDRIVLDDQKRSVTGIEALSAGLRRGWTAMMRARMDLETEAFRRQVQGRADAMDPIDSRVLWGPNWPPRIAPPARDLGQEDPSLDL
jgi:hypothetical protein